MRDLTLKGGPRWAELLSKWTQRALVDNQASHFQKPHPVFQLRENMDPTAKRVRKPFTDRNDQPEMMAWISYVDWQHKNVFGGKIICIFLKLIGMSAFSSTWWKSAHLCSMKITYVECQSAYPASWGSNLCSACLAQGCLVWRSVVQVDIDKKQQRNSYSASRYPFKCLCMVCSFKWTYMSIKIRIFTCYMCVPYLGSGDGWSFESYVYLTLCFFETGSSPRV